MLRWFRNLNVGTKIRLGFVVFGLIFFFNITVVLNIFNQTNTLNDRIAELRSPTAENSFLLLNGINHSLAALRGWLLMGEEHFKFERQKAWKEEVELPLKKLTALSKSWTNPQNNLRLDSISESLKDLEDYQKKIESLTRDQGWSTSNYILSDKAAPLAQAITILIGEMAENQKELLKNDLRESREILYRGEKMLWASLFVSLFFGFIVAVPITLSITRPLKRITDFSKNIAAGDLKQKSIERKSNDEIGVLTHNLNQMVFGLLGNLKEKEARNFAILYNILDPLIEIDEQGTIGTFNPAAVNVFGYSASEVMGKNINMLVPDSHHGKHSAYIKNRRKDSSTKNARELVGKRKDDSTFPMEVSINEFKVKNKTRFVGIYRDITEQKKTRQAIEKNNKDLEKQNWLITHLGELSDKLRGDQDCLGLAQNIVNGLAEVLKAHSGLIYLVDAKKLKTVAGFGFSRQEEYTKEFFIGEGLVGKVVLEQQTIVLNDVPEDHIGNSLRVG